MKKFALLLAIVATFAMSEAAFAANLVSIPDMSNVDTGINMSNIGKVTATKDTASKIVSATAPIYVISDDRVDTLTAAVSASVSAATDGSTNANTIQGVFAPENLKKASDNSDVPLKIAADTNTTAYPRKLTVSVTGGADVSLDLVPPEIKINAMGFADSPLSAGKFSDLTLVKTAVELALQPTTISADDGVITLPIAGLGCGDEKISLVEMNGLGLMRGRLLYQAQLNATSPLWLTGGVASGSSYDSETKGTIGGKFNYALSEDMSITISADKTVVSGDKITISVYSNQTNLIIRNDGLRSMIAGIGKSDMTAGDASEHGDLIAELTIEVVSSDAELEAEALDTELAKTKSDIIVGTPKPGANTVVVSGDLLIFNDAKVGEIKSDDISSRGSLYQVVILAEDCKSISRDAYPGVTMAYTLTADATPKKIVTTKSAGFEFGISEVIFEKSFLVANYARTSTVGTASTTEYGTDFIIGAKSDAPDGEPKVDDYKFHVANGIQPDSRTSGSSGGGCDMCFGLVAVAGLAALALRKRSK